jgi:hypothetical protein
MDSNSSSNILPEGSISPTGPGPNRESSNSKTQFQFLNSILTEPLGLVEPSPGKAGIGFNKNASNQTDQGQPPSVDGMTAIIYEDGNLVDMENPWANATIDPHELFQSFQAFESGAGGDISNMNVYRSITPNDTPESSKSGVSEPNGDISEGVVHDLDLDLFLNLFDDNLVPFVPSEVGTSYDTSSSNLLMEEDISMSMLEYKEPPLNLHWDEDRVGQAACQAAFYKPFNFDTSLYSTNAALPLQARRHNESRLPPVSRPTRRNIEIPMAPESQTSTSICGDSSAGFETDSTWSGEGSDWGEDFPQIYDYLGLLAQDMGNADLPIRPLLTSMKQELVDGIMREFWIIFNQEWSTNIQKRSGGSPQSTSSSISQHNNKSGKPSTSRGQKRERKDDDEIPRKIIEEILSAQK